MLKPGPSYRMSRAHKVMLASYIDAHRRGEIKRTIIQADLHSRTGTPRNHDKKATDNS